MSSYYYTAIYVSSYQYTSIYVSAYYYTAINVSSYQYAAVYVSAYYNTAIYVSSYYYTTVLQVCVSLTLFGRARFHYKHLQALARGVPVVATERSVCLSSTP